jgi:hypothetical protein
MKTIMLIAALVLGAGVSAKESSGTTTTEYPGGKRKKSRGFNYKQHRAWTKSYPKCRMN